MTPALVLDIMTCQDTGTKFNLLNFENFNFIMENKNKTYLKLKYSNPHTIVVSNIKVYIKIRFACLRYFLYVFKPNKIQRSNLQLSVEIVLL